MSDTVQAADAAREALRTLTSTTRDLESPSDVAAVLDVLASGIVLVRQMLNRLADWDERSGEQATDVAGDRRIGRQATDLRATADSLLDAQAAVAMAAGRYRQLLAQTQPTSATPQEQARRVAPATSFGTASTPHGAGRRSGVERTRR